MARRKDTEESWDLDRALAALRSRIDPYIWDQGQELFRRGAAEDFSILGDRSVQVKVVDPRDSRSFFVRVHKERGGGVTATCGCPYRLAGTCRHQVVALEFLGGLAREAARAGEGTLEPVEVSAVGDATEDATEKEESVAGPALYTRVGPSAAVATRPDGSLLRVALHALGSLATPHRVALQLYSGTGWTELRRGDVERWIRRGKEGPHLRDLHIGKLLSEEGHVRSQIDSETLAGLLTVLAGSDALVDRSGNPLGVSPEPWSLAARIGRGEDEPLSLEVSLWCRSSGGDTRELDEVSVVGSVAPWIQLESGCFHPLRAGAPGPVVEAIQEEGVSHLARDDLERFLADGLPRLEQLCRGDVETEPDLIREVEGVDGARLRLDGRPDRLEGELFFSHGESWVPAASALSSRTVEAGGEILRLPPAGQAMSRARHELERLGFREDDGRWVRSGPGSLSAVLRPRPGAFVRLELPPRLEALDLVEHSPELRLRVSPSGGAPRSTSGRGEDPRREAPAGESGGTRGRAGHGIAWFEVSWELVAGERSLPVDLDLLRAQAAREPAGTVELADGTVLGLQHDAVGLLLELSETSARRGLSGTTPGRSLALPPVFLGDLMEEREGIQVDLSGGIRRLAEGLRHSAGLPAPDLSETAARLLRGYQKVAVSWFGELGRWGLSGILADEMGLGKTVMMLAHFFGRARGGPAGGPPVVIVCPTSLAFNWLDECRRFFPEVRAVVLQGRPPAEREEMLSRGLDLIITSYALLRRDREILESRVLRAVVLDEAQHIKNPESQTARAACALSAGERWALTGTPVENHLGELWSLFQFLMPGFLGELREFRELYGDPVRAGDADAALKLRARVRPFLLRRTKSQVLAELPPRIEQVERAPLSELQRRLYEEQLAAARSELEGGKTGDAARSRFRILAALTRLRQICCHPRLVLEGEAGPDGGVRDVVEGGGKFDLCLELLEECREEGHRVLLFSQFTSMLDLIEDELAAREVPSCRLDGSTKDRRSVVERFQEEPSITVFLISLKAGGFGLNLTQADTVILYDPWWNPAVEEQAAARAHRIGQTVPVHVHRLVTAGTVEERILDLQATKREMVRAVVRSEEEALDALSFEDLRSLLEG